MNEKIIIPALFAMLILVATGVYIISDQSSSKTSQKSDATTKTDEVKVTIETTPSTTTTSEYVNGEAVEQDDIDALLIELKADADLDSTISIDEDTEVIDSNTISTDGYSKIYDPSEF